MSGCERRRTGGGPRQIGWEKCPVFPWRVATTPPPLLPCPISRNLRSVRHRFHQSKHPQFLTPCTIESTFRALSEPTYRDEPSNARSVNASMLAGIWGSRGSRGVVRAAGAGGAIATRSRVCRRDCWPNAEPFAVTTARYRGSYPSQHLRHGDFGVCKCTRLTVTQQAGRRRVQSPLVNYSVLVHPLV